MYGLRNTNIGISRSRLLATVSGLALIVSVGAIEPALADGRPTVWLDFGWDFENIHDSASSIEPPLGPLVPPAGLTGPLAENLSLARSYSDEGKITFQPDGSDWAFSASIRYGRSRGTSRIHQALAPIPTTNFTTYAFTYPLFPSSNKISTQQVPKTRSQVDEETRNAETHFIVDFEAGKDVGIGMFGRGSKSFLSGGVRFAHFAVSRQTDSFQETKGIQFASSHFMTTHWPGYGTNRRELWDSISAKGGASQNFNGIGPSIRWDASARLWGNSQDSVSFDWGANAALLFGRQKKKIHHQSTYAAECFGRGCSGNPPMYTSHGDVRSSKNVTVPNVGGFVGFSITNPGLKVSFGYRADLFMNAIDVGLDTQKSSNLLFHGPYASISVGFGD